MFCPSFIFVPRTFASVDRFVVFPFARELIFDIRWKGNQNASLVTMYSTNNKCDTLNDNSHKIYDKQFDSEIDFCRCSSVISMLLLSMCVCVLNRESVLADFVIDSGFILGGSVISDVVFLLFPSLPRDRSEYSSIFNSPFHCV